MRVKKKKPLRAGTVGFLSTAGKQQPFWYACFLALLCTLFGVGMSVVGLRAAENQYIDSYSIVTWEPTGPLSGELSVLGWQSRWDFSAVNQAAGWVQKVFPLIPAPLRFGKQLSILGEQALTQFRELQRQRDFIENVSQNLTKQRKWV